MELVATKTYYATFIFWDKISKDFTDVKNQYFIKSQQFHLATFGYNFIGFQYLGLNGIQIPHK